MNDNQIDLVINHLIWFAKCHKPFLVGEVVARLEEIARLVAAGSG